MADAKEEETAAVVVVDSQPPNPANKRNLPKDIEDELTKSFQKATVKCSDMSTEVQSEAIDLIISAIDKQGSNYEAAARIVKEQMDRKFGPTWNCIIGEGYAFEITHQTKYMLHLYYLGNIATLLFKC